MTPFTSIPIPDYNIGKKVWIKVPINYLDAEYDEPPVFECEVVGIKLTAQAQMNSTPTYSYEYELDIIASLDAPVTRNAEDIFKTEAEACAATIDEVKDLIDRRVKRTNMYGDILAKMYSKVDK